MSFLVSMALPFLLCAGMAAITSWLWWPTLSSPWLFAGVGFLGTLGLHRLLQAFAEFIKLFAPGGYLLEARERPTALHLAKESLNIETFILSAVLVCSGMLLLSWLRAAMVKA